MPKIQDIFSDVLLRYRHTYNNDQLIVWYNEIMDSIYEELEIDSEPYGFQLVTDQNYYPIPTGVDVNKIKVMTIQINDGDPPAFHEIPFYRNDNNQMANVSGVWCTIIGDNFYINASIVQDRMVLIFQDRTPIQATVGDLGNESELPYKYQGLLKLRLLQRIAEARKDVTFSNNFKVLADEMEEDFVWSKKMNEPEFSNAVDMMPLQGRYRHYRRPIVITQFME